MYLKRYFPVIFFIFFVNFGFAKNYIVNNIYQADNDLSARINSITDSNNNPCSIFKIQIPCAAEFKGDIYGEIKRNGNEYTLNVSSAIEELTIYPKDGNTLKVDLSFYPYFPFQPKATYIFQIKPYDEIDNNSNLEHLSNKELEDLAVNGDINACYILGLSYCLGDRNFEVDFNTGFKWIEKAAKLNHPEAQLDLGKLYYSGSGNNEQDYDKAAYWFKKSSDQNNGNAQYFLGCLNSNLFCKNVTENRTLAKYWFEKSVENNFPMGNFALSLIYFDEKNYDLSKKLAEAAAMEGILASQYFLGELYGMTDLPFYNATNSEFWLQTAAEGGLGDAQYSLGEFYENGLGGEVKMNDAIYWYNEAKKNNNQDAIIALKRLGK